MVTIETGKDYERHEEVEKVVYVDATQSMHLWCLGMEKGEAVNFI